MRVSMDVLRRLNTKRELYGLSIEEVSIESGLSIMTTTRALKGLGCNLAEFTALCLALNQSPADVFRSAMAPPLPPVTPR